MIIVLELVKEWMIIVLEFGKEVDDHFNAYLITLPLDHPSCITWCLVKNLVMENPMGKTVVKVKRVQLRKLPLE